LVWGVLVVVGSGLAGCQAHVALQAPGASATLEERTKAYEQLRALSSHETLTVTTQYGVPIAATSEPTYLQLKNGARVYHPEDLLPVLPADSVAAKAAQESQSARQSRNTVIGVGVAIGVVGVIAMVAIHASVQVPDLPLDVTQAQFEQHMKDTQAALRQGIIGYGVGLGGVAVGALVVLVGNLVYGRNAADAMRTAFETFDTGLRAKLDLPGDGAARLPPVGPGAWTFAPAGGR
jgi:hypothetical protein